MLSPIVIVGTLPPPVGGVTRHVERLVASLTEREFDYLHYDPRHTSVVRVLIAIARAHVCHLHVSRAEFLLGAALLCKMSRTKLIITVHRDIRGLTGLKRWILAQAIASCDVPILLNPESLNRAKLWNSRALLLSAFIPRRSRGSSLPASVISTIAARSEQFATVICTNAFRLAYDELGREVYGIFELSAFAQKRGALLVLSDPSGEYTREFRARYCGLVPEWVITITEDHEFSDVLPYADVFIRNTITDGDSLSVHEALDAGVPVWASAVVERPLGVHLFHRLTEIDLSAPSARREAADCESDSDPVAELMRLYRRVLEPRDIPQEV